MAKPLWHLTYIALDRGEQKELHVVLGHLSG